MAEGSAVKNGVFKTLEQEVKCPLCLDIFTEPKRLPCEHVFCAQCLQVLALRAIDDALICPVCRKHTPLQGTDVEQFHTAYQVNTFIEMYHKTLKQQTATCTLHISQPLALYCETCKKFVCRDCVINFCSKRNHDYGFLEDMAKKYRAELDKELQPITTLHQDMTTALVAFKTANQEMERQKEERMERVEAAFDMLSNILQQEKEILTSAIEVSFTKPLSNNISKIKELSMAVAELETFIQSTENMSLAAEPIPVIRKEVMEKKQEVELFKAQFRELSLHPVGPPELDTEVFGPQDLDQLCQKMRDEYESHFNRSTRFQSMKLGQPFQVNLVSFSPLKIKSKLVCTYDKTSQSVDVSQISPKKFRLSVVPQKRGRHELHIHHSDIHLCGSPISSYVYIDPQQITTLGKPLRKSLQLPCSVKCYDDKVYVVEYNKGIAILEHPKKSMNLLKRIPLLGAIDMIMHDNFIYYTDAIGERVVKVDLNGHTIASTGGQGTEEGKFDFPNGIRLSKESEIYVCDSENHRFQVFDIDLKLIRTFGKEGTGPEQFDFPCDLIFDEEGNIYIVERDNHRVQVLTPQGQHIRFIGKFGYGLEELNNPVSADIRENTLYITDSGNKRVIVFTTAGEYVTTFGKGELTDPECIAIDRDGFIFVTDNRSNILRF